MEVTRKLELEILPECAAFLDRYYQDVPLDSMDLSDEFVKLTNTIHRKGATHIRPNTRHTRTQHTHHTTHTHTHTHTHD